MSGIPDSMRSNYDNCETPDHLAGRAARRRCLAWAFTCGCNSCKDRGTQPVHAAESQVRESRGAREHLQEPCRNARERAQPPPGNQQRRTSRARAAFDEDEAGPDPVAATLRGRSRDRTSAIAGCSTDFRDLKPRNGCSGTKQSWRSPTKGNGMKPSPCLSGSWLMSPCPPQQGVERVDPAQRATGNGRRTGRPQCHRGIAPELEQCWSPTRRCALLLTGLLGYLTFRRIVKPIQALETSVKSIAAGDYAKEVPFTQASRRNRWSGALG